jgi:hypothetical protein
MTKAAPGFFRGPVISDFVSKTGFYERSYYILLFNPSTDEIDSLN